jgi:polyhydroxyalkanoate synthase
VLGASGHIAGVINPAAKNKRNYWANGSLSGEPDAWLDSAETVPGNWWPHWADWLKQQAGENVNALKKMGNQRYKAIEPAPGRYVRQRVD